MAVRLSIKSSKPAYTLTMKLVPGLFTKKRWPSPEDRDCWQERMILKPVLDKEKISTLKGRFLSILMITVSKAHLCH
jgi:hypothetical protein